MNWDDTFNWKKSEKELPDFHEMVLVWGPLSAHQEHYAIACRVGCGGSDWEWHYGYCSDPLLCSDHIIHDNEVFYWCELPTGKPMLS